MRVLLACPHERDREEVSAAGLDARVDVRFAGPDLDALETVDAKALLAQLADVPADAVVATKDRAALAAALVARARGVVGPPPEAVVACQYKPQARAVAARVVPEATPRFAVLDGGARLAPPFFAKPAVGRLSQRARRIDDAAALAELRSDEAYVAGWLQLARRAGFSGRAAHLFLAEELLHGREVTLEGFVDGGRVTVVGVTDSVMYPGTNSFERFEYPSSLPDERLAELGDVTTRLVPALGLDHSFFNVEFFVPEHGPAKVTEVNARIASQFAPLVRALHGRSTYELLFDLALGRHPQWDASTPAGVAVSYVVRAFEDALVDSVPDPEPALEILVRPGRRLSEQGPNDVGSYRLAIVYESAETREEAVSRARERASSLPFRLA